MAGPCREPGAAGRGQPTGVGATGYRRGRTLSELFVYAIRAAQQKSVEEQQELEAFGFTAGEFVEAERRAHVRKEWKELKAPVRKQLAAEGKEPAELKPYYRWEVPDPDYFRIHDAGDMGWARAYTEAWLDVCRELKDVAFWAPTRAWAVNRALPVDLLRKVPRNLVLRPSALHFRQPAPTAELIRSIGLPVAGAWGGGGLSAGSGAASGEIPADAWGCPAYLHWSAGGGALLPSQRGDERSGVGGTCALARGPRAGCHVETSGSRAAGCRVCWGTPAGCQQRAVFYHEH